MNSELKYVLKGVLYACLFFTVIYIFYYAFSYKKTVEKKQPIITRDDLMNLPEVVAGKDLFEKNCSACHKLHAADQAWSGLIIQKTTTKKIYMHG